jgi:DNA-binding MarR family transcriptional regulator
VLQFDAMRLMPWPELDQQLAFVSWASVAINWAELLAFDAPGSLVVVLMADAGSGQVDSGGDARATLAQHRQRCGYLDLVWRHEGVWQRLDGRVVDLSSDVIERVRCDVLPYFDSGPGAAAAICRRFGPRAERLNQLRLTEAQRAQLARVQPLVDACASHLLDDVQRQFLREHPELRSTAPELEPPLRDYLQSREQLDAELRPLQQRETAKLWGALHRLGGLLGYRLH